MLDPKIRTAEAAIELLGELHRFAEQLGSPAELLAVAAAPWPRGSVAMKNGTAFRRFLETYCSQILVPHELPAINKAYLHASRYEVRELIASDWELGQEPKLQRFALVSQLLGTTQLQKLRPLRDQRLVRRYCAAVESGQAHGWHTVVYGLILALFSVPLRQGMLNYGEQIIQGFIESANGSLRLAHGQCRELYLELSAPLPEAVERILRSHGTAFARSA